jgi:hypothetical protein
VSFRILYCKPVSYKHGPEKPRKNDAKKNAVNIIKEKVKNVFVHGVTILLLPTLPLRPLPIPLLPQTTHFHLRERLGVSVAYTCAL